MTFLFLFLTLAFGALTAATGESIYLAPQLAFLLLFFLGMAERK